MLSEDTNIRFFTHPKMCQLPIGIQSELMCIFTDVLSDIKEGNSYATVQSLFAAELQYTGVTESD